MDDVELEMIWQKGTVLMTSELVEVISDRANMLPS